MNNETLAHLAEFNTNAACAGAGPSDVPVEPSRTIGLVFYVSAAIFMLVTSIWYIYMRQYRRRLKIRALNPIVTGSMGSACIILVRAYYNYVGREYFSCSANLAFAYLFFLFNLVPDNLLVSSFLIQQKLREHFATAAVVPSHNAGPASNKVEPADKVKRSSEQAPKVENQSVVTGGMSAGDSSTFLGHKFATPVTWAKGFWNHFLLFQDSVQFQSGSKINFHSKWRFREDTRVSSGRELTYDMALTAIYSGSLFFGMGMRLGLVPVLQVANGCTGCTMLWEDIPILFACVFWLAFLQTLILVRTRSIVDPLNYKSDLTVQSSLTGLAWISYILVVTDPGGRMQSQNTDWFFIESAAALILHCHRCILQLWRVSRIHKKAEQNIRLIDVLQDPKAAIMFEKYLMGELASENLLFWREGIKYKVNFDKNKDFDYSQQVAKMLLRTFISKHAQLPINISGSLRETIEARFKGGFVGKNVFDEALADLYKMMQNGPFYRFVRSPVYQEYVKNSADFSMTPAATAQMSMGPGALVAFTRTDSNVDVESLRSATSVGSAATPAVASVNGHFDVNEFIRSL